MSYENCPACGDGHREDCPVCGGPPPKDPKLEAAAEALKSEDILGDIGARILNGLSDRLILYRALDRWGLSSQLAMLAEESAELTAATMHVLREHHEGDDEAAWVDEVADVWIMIDQMLLTPWAPQIVEARARKMERLARRLAEASDG